MGSPQNLKMSTLDLTQAAMLLHCDPETVRGKVASGEIPGAKIGRAWVFIEVDLIDWLRTQYGKTQQEAECRSIVTKKAR